MTIKILVIAPYQGLVELINNSRSKLADFEITLEQGDLNESLHLLGKYTNSNFDFIISRGGTSTLIKKNTSIPVLNIPISGYDILRMLTLLKGYQSTTIGMIGFNNVIKSFESISNLIDININYIEIKHENEVAETVEFAKKQGVKVIVGDTSAVRLANEMGLQGVLITSGKESVLETFEVARQMYIEINRLKSKNDIFELLLNESNEGIVIIDERGYIKFANSIFFQLLDNTQTELNERSLFEEHPFFMNALSLQENDLPITFQLANNNFDEVYKIKTGLINEEKEDNLRYIQLQKSTFNKQSKGVQLIYPNKIAGSVSQFITNGPLYEVFIACANQRLKRNLPIVLLGEIGVGKRILIQALANLSSQNNESNYIEININKMSTKLFNRLLLFIEELDEQMILYIRGIELATPSQQQKLFERIPSLRVKIAFSFIGDLQNLQNNERKLNTDLLNMFLEEPLSIPPLRERKSELKELIQTFIMHFNEVFGKQVVGLRPMVMESFLSHPWYGNLIELRSVLKEVIEQSASEYLTEDALAILKTHNLSNKVDPYNRGTYIQLNQPLDMIEKDIIQIVMEQENMNQSKVAKRLGINRSTLWRKMKLIEDSE